MLEERELGQDSIVTPHALMSPPTGGEFRLNNTMAVSEAFRGAGLIHARAVVRNLSVLPAEHHMDALHQSRVSIRRLRAIFSLFKPTLRGSAMEDVLAKLKWISDLLGRAREYDVLIHRILEPIAAGNPDVVGFESLLRSFCNLRQRACEAVLAGLGEGRILHLELALEKALGDQPGGLVPVQAPLSAGRDNASIFIAAALRRRLKGFLDEGDCLATVDHAQQHRMRVRAKKLRYMIESFSELLPGLITGEVSHRLRDFQDAFGDINDGRVSRVLILDWAGGSARRAGERSWLVAAGVAASESIRHEERALSRAQAAFAELAEPVQSFLGARSTRPSIERL
jgi:triphosphatase